MQITWIRSSEGAYRLGVVLGVASIVLAIVGLLVLGSRAHYRTPKLDHESNAKIGLLELHSAQERYHALNDRYTDNLSLLVTQFDLRAEYGGYRLAIPEAGRDHYRATATDKDFGERPDVWRICACQCPGDQPRGEPYQLKGDSGLEGE